MTKMKNRISPKKYHSPDRPSRMRPSALHWRSKSNARRNFPLYCVVLVLRAELEGAYLSRVSR